MTPASPAAKRYFRRAILCYLVYGALVVGLVLLAGKPLGGWVRVAYAAPLAPAVPVLAVVIATARYFATETSQLQRDIQLEALLWAVGVTFCVATTWGLLGLFAGAPQAPSYWAFAVFGSVVGSVQVARRLFPRRRPPGESLVV